ncbi:MAG: 50S ribosomal protein L4 [Intrasporangiaceae bacterium]|nr:50S ribosomal protein L4 [Intrasporangiaceae bacterium]
MATDTTLKTVDVDLPAEIFDVQTNVPLIHQVVVAQLAAARQGTHATKTRADVRGGGRKPYRQKGTGRARQGSTRAPQFAGGGVVHGPQPRDYSQRTPKKMKAAALRGALSDRARHGRIHVIESLAVGETPSTKTAAVGLASLTERKNLLVVLERADILGLKSIRNVANVHVLAVDQLNTYDVLCADDVVFTKAAFDQFVSGAPAAAAAAEADADTLTLADHAVSDTADAEAATAPVALAAAADEAEAEAAEVELPKGAAASLEDGSAPEGYTIKGNAASGLYHEPDGQWYDSTVAEFWFKTAKAAEKAGFTKAGTKKSEDEK